MAKSKNHPTPKNPKRVEPLTEAMGDFDPYRPYFGLLDQFDPRSYNETNSGHFPYNLLFPNGPPYNPFFPEGVPNGMFSAPALDDDYSYHTRPNQSVMEQNAAYNAFRQNYERSQSENIRESAMKLMEQRIARGYREPINQPSAPQFVFPIKNGYDGRGTGTGTDPKMPPGTSPKISPKLGIPPSERPGYGRPLPVPVPPTDGRRIPLPMPGTGVPPSSGKFGGYEPLPYPGNPGIRNPHTPIQPLQPPQQGKPPIYKAPPTNRFAPQPAPLPPISMPDKLPPRVGGLPAIPDKLPQEVRRFINPKQPKKPTLNSFIPRYERD